MRVMFVTATEKPLKYVPVKCLKHLMDGTANECISPPMDVTATEHYSIRISPPLDENAIAHGLHRRYM